MPACARRLLGSSWQQQRSTARNEECGAGGTCPCESGHASALTIASSHRERRSVLPNAAAAARVATERHAERHGGSPGKASSATLLLDRFRANFPMYTPPIGHSTMVTRQASESHE